MNIIYKNKKLERLLILTNLAVTTLVIATALLQLGFYRQILPDTQIYLILIAATFFFIVEKVIRFFNARSKKDYLIFCWFEFIFIILLVVLYYSAGTLWALGVYLLLQVITKVCRTMVNLAASGKSPALTFVGSFIVIILTGSILLMLPRSYKTEPINFVDALFTATSATCVTGLTVKDIGTDFSVVGQTVILVLIQLGGLGIVIFGAVFSLLFGQALNVRQSVAMQDLLSAQTVSKITHIIAFIFITVVVMEGLGALILYNMWDTYATLPGNIHSKWFCSIFHSISAFCNAGLGLFSDSFMGFKTDWRIYFIICPMIIIGGLGFGVLFNLATVLVDKIRFLLNRFRPYEKRHLKTPVRVHLQTKIVLTVSLILILAGTAGLLIIQNNTGNHKIGLSDAFFQSVTARTAGFNTIETKALSIPAKMVLMILMFIGGSPASTAGGIKTVTFAVIFMAAYATVRKRSEVEIFKRSVPLVMVGKALTVILLFAVLFFTSAFLLTITERHSNFDTSAILFETVSAIGTVGLSCSITSSLTTAGKLIIIITMLIGRLGALTLLAALTFNITPARYNYPAESLVVG
ncbi:MAG: Trk family potassium uptake protein [Planctomycetes bacterium]|nr:Trk family potassium uptake protein [Planctomycetota bacterium]MBU1517735.1 Trk family potassium uptake protein [Planctomycetota bacterium]MBU2457849.1 Trk family potassium uptake protein [Planctomycetota bacterium]MBU2597295.1 Trk family potassium uptake protein [Planctomycetota bacterium]